MYYFLSMNFTEFYFRHIYYILHNNCTFRTDIGLKHNVISLLEVTTFRET